MPWLIVLSEREAIQWVLDNQRMAFRAKVRTELVRRGDPFALYTTRGAFHSPASTESQVVAVGTIASAVRDGAVEVAGAHYVKSCKLSISRSLAPREGLPFRSLVPHLAFIHEKSAWAAYLRRTLVWLSPADFERIRAAFVKFASAA